MKKFKVKFDDKLIANIKIKNDIIDLVFVEETVTLNSVARVFKFFEKELLIKDSTINQLTFEKGVKTIAPRAFSGRKIKTLIITSDLTSIGAFAFDNCGIEKIEYLYKFDKNGYIKEGLVNIFESAFSHNEIKELFLPNTLLRIDPRAFAHNNLEKTYMYKETITLLTDNKSIFLANENNQFYNASFEYKKNSKKII